MWYDTSAAPIAPECKVRHGGNTQGHLWWAHFPSDHVLSLFVSTNRPGWYIQLFPSASDIVVAGSCKIEAANPINRRLQTVRCSGD